MDEGSRILYGAISLLLLCRFVGVPSVKTCEGVAKLADP